MMGILMVIIQIIILMVIILMIIIQMMVIQIASSLFSLASKILPMRLLSQMRESTTMPTTLFMPTRMQPCVSSGKLPAWMRMPSKPGTPCTKGNQRLNLGDHDTNTG